jgi:putative glutamine amidotransferase
LLISPGEKQIDRLLQILDGLVFAGGGDIDPVLYGGPTHSSIDHIDTVRDQFELALAQKIVKTTIPVLGICRGSQLLAINSGAKLITHIPAEPVKTIKHKAANGQSTKHFVIVEPKSRLASIAGQTKFEVESMHHQGIQSVPMDWRVMAKSEDGLIESLEHVGHPWMISVLWHPEMSPEDPVQQSIFRAFVEAAAEW